MQRTMSRSPAKGHTLRVTIDFTDEETKNEIAARQQAIFQEQGRLGTLEDYGAWLEDAKKALR